MLKFGVLIDMHSSFTTVENFIRQWAYLHHPVMLKQCEIEHFIGFGVLRASQLIRHAARLLYYYYAYRMLTGRGLTRSRFSLRS